MDVLPFWQESKHIVYFLLALLGLIALWGIALTGKRYVETFIAAVATGLFLAIVFPLLLLRF